MMAKKKTGKGRRYIKSRQGASLQDWVKRVRTAQALSRGVERLPETPWYMLVTGYKLLEGKVQATYRFKTWARPFVAAKMFWQHRKNLAFPLWAAPFVWFWVCLQTVWSGLRTDLWKLTHRGG